MAASLRCVALLFSLCVLPPLGRSQGPHPDHRINNPQAPHAPGGIPLSAARLLDLLKEESSHLDQDRMYGSVAKDSEKIVIFITAAGGTVTLMAVMYCIYNNFYPKSQYLHTPLQDETDLTLDYPKAAPVYFQGSGVMDRDRKMWGGSTASVSDTPSIIHVPPSLSPPPSLIPSPPLFLSSYHLRTISAQDLERSCV